MRSIMYLSLPMVATFLLQDAFNLVDMFFVGKLGSDALASVSMAGVILGLIITAVMGLSFGTIALVSRYAGEGNIDKADNVVMQSFLLGLILTVIVSVTGWIFTPDMLELLGASEDVVAQGTSYLRIMFGGSITIFLTVLFFSALRGAGDPITPMVILIISTILNIILDPIMIFGLFGFPELGVAGSAAATIIARTVALLMIFYVMVSKRSVVKLGSLHIDLGTIWKIIKIGAPGSIRFIIIHISSLVLIIIVSSFGTAAIAAYGVGTRLNMVVMNMVSGFGTAASILIGQNLGAGNHDRAEKSGWLSAGISVAIMAPISVLFFLFADEIISIFNAESEVVRIGSQLIRIIAPSFIFLGLNITLNSALNGAGDTIHPMLFSSISMLILRVPIAAYLAQSFGITGVWISWALTTVVHAILSIAWFKIGRWKRVKF